MIVNTEGANWLRKFAGKLNEVEWRGFPRLGVQLMLRAQMLYTRDPDQGGNKNILRPADRWIVEFDFVKIRPEQLCIAYKIPNDEWDDEIPERRRGQWNCIPLEEHPREVFQTLDYLIERALLEPERLVYPDPYIPPETQ